MTQEELIRAAQGGDRQAMTSLIGQYEGLCRKAAGQAHLAPIAGEALAAAREAVWRAAREFDEGRGVPFPGYAKAMVYGALWTLFKQHRRRWQREMLPEGQTETPYFETLADARDETARIDAEDAFRALIAPLAEKPRKLLTLLYVEDCTQKEAARRLGIPERSAAVMKGRALKKLRAILGESGVIRQSDE
ncbi:MAG: RNA polymerase sigma factor [Schwartzia sp.]|nr:RNA polymerase sigma factor [Schwartzia sp. (in: firmicutes)]